MPILTVKKHFINCSQDGLKSDANYRESYSKYFIQQFSVPVLKSLDEHVHAMAVKCMTNPSFYPTQCRATAMDDFEDVIVSTTNAQSH